MTLDQVLIDAETRRKVIVFAVRSMNVEVPFYFGVEAYKMNPTKSKALMLYDKFVAPTDNMNMTEEAKLNLKPRIEALRELREQAMGMNLFSRILSSGGRKPPRDLFDEAQKSVDGQGMIRSDFMKQYNNYVANNTKLFVSESDAAIQIREYRKWSEEAGFEPRDIGLH